MDNLSDEALQKEFMRGTVPGKLNGFYRGSLSMLLAETGWESLGSLLLKLWLPWKGKYFYADKQRGDNIVPPALVFLLKLRYLRTRDFVSGKGFGGIHAFPFKTVITRGLLDRREICRLDYDLPANPALVRQVVDELVCVGKDKYLGKAYLVGDNGVRTVAFFRLEKLSDRQRRT